MKKAKLVFLNQYMSEGGNMTYVYAVVGKNTDFIDEYQAHKEGQGYGNVVEADDENPNALQNKYVGAPLFFSTDLLMQGTTLIKTRNGNFVAQKPETQQLLEKALDRHVAKMFKSRDSQSANDDEDEDEDEVPAPNANAEAEEA